MNMNKLFQKTPYTLSLSALLPTPKNLLNKHT
uniref:Uncharacterized protein n=1 Tax=Rhizophora mucronata TaxID=61149 RepID=A0A2P2PAA1_RHIMU